VVGDLAAVPVGCSFGGGHVVSLDDDFDPFLLAAFAWGRAGCVRSACPQGQDQANRK
jgi:hypothetical protein